jgi:hypothetical protein
MTYAQRGRESANAEEEGANAFALCVLPSLPPITLSPSLHARSCAVQCSIEGRARDRGALARHSSIVLVHRRAVEALESDTTGNDDRQHESRQERELMYHTTQQVLQYRARPHTHTQSGSMNTVR